MSLGEKRRRVTKASTLIHQHMPTSPAEWDKVSQASGVSVDFLRRKHDPTYHSARSPPPREAPQNRSNRDGDDDNDHRRKVKVTLARVPLLEKPLPPEDD